MEPRYNKISNYITKSYNPLCPVDIIDGLLSYDNHTNSTLLQLKFFNRLPQTITSIFIGISCYDAAGDLLETDGTVNSFFSELELKENETYSNKTPVVLSSIVRDVKVIIEKIVFSSGEIWRSNGGEVVAPKLIQLTEIGDELNLQFLREQENLPQKHNFKYIPVIEGSKWFCSCGCINDIEKLNCVRCGISREWIFNHTNVENLKVNLVKYNEELENTKIQMLHEQELAKKKNAEDEEERARREAEKKAIDLKRMKRNQKIITRSMIVLVPTILLGSYFYINNLKPKMDYNKAIELYKDNKHKEAVDILDNLEGYKDSDQLIEEIERDAIYFKAMNYFNSSDYIKAVAEFNQVIDYKDSKEMIIKSKYELAKELYLEENYERVVVYLNEVKDYYDVNEEYEDAIYKSGEKLFQNKSFYKAREYFNMLTTGTKKNTSKYLDTFYYKIEGVWKETTSNNENDNDTYEFRLREDGKLVETNLADGTSMVLEWRDEPYVFNRGIVENLYKIIKVDKRAGGELVIDWLRYSDRNWKRNFVFVSDLRN